MRRLLAHWQALAWSAGLLVAAIVAGLLMHRVLFRDASTAWDLRCEVRERLVDFLQREHSECLPRRRAEQGPLVEAGPAPRREADATAASRG